MSEETEQEREFKRFFEARLFGLMALVDRPRDNEHFPMASGVCIESNGFCILVTAAHYLQDVCRWKDEGRLEHLGVVVNQRGGISKAIPLDIGNTPCFYFEPLDIGFMILPLNVASELTRRGGVLTQRDDLDLIGLDSLDELDSFYLIGHPSAYCKTSREQIAASREGTTITAWHLDRVRELAIGMSKLEYEGLGPDLGTYHFRPIQPFDNYKGMSGGPIVGFKKGSLIRDYRLIAIQTTQIRTATGAQTPKRLIATSAAVTVHLIDEKIREALAENQGQPRAADDN